jgi:hypothetical protein
LTLRYIKPAPCTACLQFLQLRKTQLLELKLRVERANLRIVWCRIDPEEDRSGLHQFVRLHRDFDDLA